MGLRAIWVAAACEDRAFRKPVAYSAVKDQPERSMLTAIWLCSSTHSKSGSATTRAVHDLVEDHGAIGSGISITSPANNVTTWANSTKGNGRAEQDRECMKVVRRVKRCQAGERFSGSHRRPVIQAAPPDQEPFFGGPAGRRRGRTWAPLEGIPRSVESGAKLPAFNPAARAGSFLADPRTTRCSKATAARSHSKPWLIRRSASKHNARSPARNGAWKWVTLWLSSASRGGSRASRIGRPRGGSWIACWVRPSP